MNHQETVMLTRLVAAACPQQAIDDYTPDAWHPLLSDLRFADCQAAMTVLGKRQLFMAPSEIRAEVRRIRDARIARSAIPAPPAELADNPRAYAAAVADLERRAGDGEFPEAAPGTLAITGAPAAVQEREPLKRPMRLGAVLGPLRRQLGAGRPATRWRGPQDIAAGQAAQSRAAREDGTEAAS